MSTIRRARISAPFTVASSVTQGFPLTVQVGQVYDLGFGLSGLTLRYGTSNYPLSHEELHNLEFLS
jgi:hypothetical protein